MSKMNHVRFERLKKKLENESMNDAQRQELINALLLRLGDNAHVKKIVVQGYTDKQLKLEKERAFVAGAEHMLQESQDFHQRRLIPYLHAATNLLQLRHNISDNVNHPRATLQTNRDYLTSTFINDFGEEIILSKVLTDSIVWVRKTELALNEYHEEDRDQSHTVSLVDDSAMIHDEMLRLENAVQDNDESAQQSAIDGIKEILLRTPSRAMRRQIEMRAQMDFGGANTNTTIDTICQWAKPIRDAGKTWNEVWIAVNEHFRENGGYAERKQLETWDKNFAGAENLSKNVRRRDKKLHRT